MDKLLEKIEMLEKRVAELEKQVQPRVTIEKTKYGAEELVFHYD
ncbi:hypothetical protein [Clostridium tunisiense]|nr:hypothetical protein [Clostridium tunisiense]